MGQAPPSQMTRVRAESSRKRNPSGQTSGHQKRKRGDPEVVEVDPLSFSLPAIHGLSSIVKLLKEGYEDQGRGAGQFEGVPEEERGRLEEDVTRMKGQLEGIELIHSLQMESLQATSVPKSRLDAYILVGVQRYLGSSEFALGINDVMDPAIETGARKDSMEIEAARRKNEDIQLILDKYADREMKGKTSAMPRGTQTPPSTPPRLDEEPEVVAPAPPPQGHNSGSRGGGGTSTDSNTNSGDKGKDAALDFPPQPEGTSRGVPVTPGHWKTSGIPWIDLQLPDPHHDPTTFPLYAAVGSALVDPNVDRSRGRLSGLEGLLEEGLETFRISDLHEARRAVIEAKAENDWLDKLWRDTEAYWENHLKNSIQLEILANNRLQTFEAKIRKKKKDEGLAEPDPEDFILRNYFESVLVHLRKAYALVAVKWDRSSNKIEALRAYAGQLRIALESAISFIVETGKEYNFETLWPEPCPAIRDDPASPTREAERLIYENDALFYELGRGSH
ncbi:OLC1v1035884C1 [Oldenlandia corymbosa var. corymbosa]|uniref:OLC1v1035884C1 n=1 Tax=Oldenlandia corymbosa var. corymbosa TaxID=529605 RepID=A0AAV1CV53_OLDCO|nr:OLC1v1035884C1 [Oldenlandia corymbosa var. corymbosa]